jgi:DNA invertase Pin-like site-specific DNA recombinase
MITQDATEAIQKTRRKSRRKPGCKPKTRRPPLDASRIYTLAEAALASGCSKSTIIRARDSRNLTELRVGGKIIFSGESLLSWLNAGGKTA